MSPRALPLAALVALAACSSGVERATAPAPDASALGNGSRVSDLLGPGATLPAPNEDVSVRVTGVVVVAKDDYDETGDGKSAGYLWVQDAVFDRAKSPGFHGIEVFRPSYSPPDLRVAPGDVLDVSALFELLDGPPGHGPDTGFAAGQLLPELSSGTASFRFEMPVPEPLDVPASELATYEKAKAWIGMLVRVKDVVVADDPSTSGHRWQLPITLPGGVAGPAISNALFAVDQAGIDASIGAHYASVTGVLQYFYEFTLAPRSADDLAK